METITLENVRTNLERVLDEMNVIKNFCNSNSINLVIRTDNKYSDFLLHEKNQDLYLHRLEQVSKTLL